MLNAGVVVLCMLKEAILNWLYVDARGAMVVYGVASIVKLKDAEAPYWSTTVAVYKPAGRDGTANCVANEPSDKVGPKRLSAAVLFTVVLPNERVMFADPSKLVPVIPITASGAPCEGVITIVGVTPVVKGAGATVTPVAARVTG